MIFLTLSFLLALLPSIAVLSDGQANLTGWGNGNQIPTIHEGEPAEGNKFALAGQGRDPKPTSGELWAFDDGLRYRAAKAGTLNLFAQIPGVSHDSTWSDLRHARPYRSRLDGGSGVRRWSTPAERARHP